MDWCKYRLVAARTLRILHLCVLALWIGVYSRSSTHFSEVSSTCFYPSSGDRCALHLGVQSSRLLPHLCLDFWLMFELLVILFPRYLVVFFYDSGKISIFAGLWLRKKSVSCWLMCIRLHFTSFNIIYQMTKKRCMKGVWSSGLSKCKRFISSVSLCQEMIESHYLRKLVGCTSSAFVCLLSFCILVHCYLSWRITIGLHFISTQRLFKKKIHTWYDVVIG